MGQPTRWNEISNLRRANNDEYTKLNTANTRQSTLHENETTQNKKLFWSTENEKTRTRTKIFFFSIEAAIYVTQKKDRGQALWRSCTFIIQFILNSKFGLCQASFLAYSNRHSRYGYRTKQACGRIETKMHRGIKIQADLCLGARHCPHLRNTHLWMVFAIKYIASFPHSCSV